MTGQLVLLSLALTGCGASNCVADRVSELESTRVATLIYRCRRYPSVNDCPRADGINEKFARREQVASEGCGR